MEKLTQKLLDFLTFMTIALVAMLFGFHDTTRAAMIVDHTILYVSSISAAVVLATAKA